MAHDNIDNSQVSIHLGKTSSYKSQYDKSLLVREKRINNRKHLGIENDNLPFVGSDTWNAYEISALTDNGLPISAIAKIVYPCSNEYIVESKSLKLYLNSFNMTKLGGSQAAVVKEIQTRIEADLKELLEANWVNVIVDPSNVIYSMHYEQDFDANKEWIGDEWQTLESEYELRDVEFTQYSEDPKLLEVVDSESDEVFYHSALLKSNCRVTSQPDWGDVFIHIRNNGKTIDPVSLLQYIVSFRDECHFHEEICETIYKRIWDLLKPDGLAVKCLYTRRGGIDINPERVSEVGLMHKHLSNYQAAHVKTPKQ